MEPAVPPRPQSKRAKLRRRRRRVLSLIAYGVIVFSLAWFAESRATTTIIIVRHADVEMPVAQADDPALSAAGIGRADMLARFLADIDVLAGLDAIFADEFRRTQQTAAPVAALMGLDVEVADHTQIVQFMEHVITEYKGRIVLVVTEGELIPELVAELHGHQSVPEIEPAEYDNIYIVTSPWFGKVKTLRLRYGLGWTPPAAHTSG